jgi:FAD/FMN-containing dehydrogenase
VETMTHSIPELAAELQGRVVTPDDADYDAMRTVVSPEGLAKRPAAVVRVADARDVARVVDFARAGGWELAVRSGGHSGVGHSVSDGGIVIDLREMKDLEIDTETRTAWAQTGLTAGEYSIAANEKGLATGFGDTGSVGIGGLTTGGGIGYLVRKHGLTVDSLLAAEIVTADGQILTVDETNHPDLFWAIRGGGGNVGIATRFKFALVPIDEFTGGMLILPATAETVEGFVRAADEAQEELSTIANVMNAPPMPFLPEDVVGRVVILGMMAYAGPDDDAERALAPFRALAEPIADMVRPSPYPQMYPPEDPAAEEYHPMAVARTLMMDRVDHDTAALIVDSLNASDASMRVVQLRVLGGAMARVPADATAFAHRSSRILANVAAFYEGEEDRAVREDEVNTLTEGLRQEDTGAYVNFVGDEGDAGVRAAYPGRTYERLAEIKRRYDPTNLFRLNQNVQPA